MPLENLLRYTTICWCFWVAESIFEANCHTYGVDCTRIHTVSEIIHLVNVSIPHWEWSCDMTCEGGKLAPCISIEHPTVHPTSCESHITQPSSCGQVGDGGQLAWASRFWNVDEGSSEVAAAAPRRIACTMIESCHWKRKDIRMGLRNHEWRIYEQRMLPLNTVEEYPLSPLLLHMDVPKLSVPLCNYSKPPMVQILAPNVQYL